MGFGASKPDPDFPSITPILVPRTLKGYPPPKPSRLKKCDLVKFESFLTIDARSKAIIVSDETTYGQLQTSLTRGLVSDLDKVRAIFTWLGSQQIYHSYYPGVVDPMTPRGYMKLMKKNLGTYTEFFTLLCRAADIPCVMIRGKCKSEDYEAGEDIPACMSSKWTAVYVDGLWCIVHPFRAYSGINGKNQANTQRTEVEPDSHDSMNNNDHNVVDEFFFIPDPDDFMYFCWPEKPEWQLVEKTWTLDDFYEAPYFHSAYFTSGLTLSSEHKSSLTSKSGMCHIKFNHKCGTYANVSYILFVKQNLSGRILNNSKLEMYVCKEAKDDHINIYVRLPVLGVYKLVIYGGLTHMLNPLAEFRLDCFERNMMNNPFPIRSSLGFGPGQRSVGMGLRCVSHPEGVVPIRATRTDIFDFHHTHPMEVEAVLRHHSLPAGDLRALVKKVIAKNRVVFHVSVPEDEIDDDEFALQVFVRMPHTNYTLVNVLNFLLTVHPDMYEIEHTPTQDRKCVLDLVNWEHLEHLATTLDKVDRDTKCSNVNVAEDMTICLNNNSPVWASQEGYSRNHLSSAMNNRNRKQLEMALHGLHCNGHLNTSLKPEMAALAFLYEEEIKKRRSANDLDSLMKAIAESSESVVSENLESSPVVQSARDFLSRQLRVKQYNMVMQTLTSQTVTDVADCQRPNNICFVVLRSTYLLLGEDRPLQTWSDVQHLLRIKGHDSLINRISRFSLDALSNKVSDEVKDTLSKFKIEEVKATGSAVAAFYLWALGVVMEVG
ncbi:hillarin-like [Haliotis rufescens]|uniref:hillarin-like n=1 Tax=Haliotis rufescens TaxID=6454 RepID=UPI00201F21F4|nr:hillarin-like [Haliotis rufescens]